MQINKSKPEQNMTKPIRKSESSVLDFMKKWFKKDDEKVKTFSQKRAKAAKTQRNKIVAYAMIALTVMGAGGATIIHLVQQSHVVDKKTVPFEEASETLKAALDSKTTEATVTSSSSEEHKETETSSSDDELVKKYTELSDEKDKLDKEKDAVEKQVSELQKEISNLKSSAESLKNTNSSLQSEKSASQSENASLKSQIETLKSEILELKKQVSYVEIPN